MFLSGYNSQQFSFKREALSCRQVLKSKSKRNNLCQDFVRRNFTMTTTLGEKSLELIRESLRSRDMLGPFNEEKVRAVLEEIKALHDEVFTYILK